ncbi:uncharacterized protein LOC143540533 [Bidens hawaiensis]|uniref:uncharacterized protein LOC143540533 n=1 Tax=Bidens hawaiensis TaxID=980011 RepID=UPI004049DD05
MASSLIHKTTYEADNAFYSSLTEAFRLLEPQLRPPFPLTIRTQPQYFTLNRAILHGILSQPHLAKVHIKHLHGVATDGYAVFTNSLCKLVDQLYSKLAENVKVQLIYICSQLIDVSAVGIDNLLVSLLRQIRGGDFSEPNLWLCLEMVSIFTRKWECLVEERTGIISCALYVFLRVLSDHCRVSSNPQVKILKQKSIEFCVRVFKEQFHLCLKIGRDLIRVLQDLVHVPEFKNTWKDSLSRDYDISRLYRSKTCSKYFLLRITPEMETCLRFLLTKVKLGSQTRYQIWFARKFLNGPEKETVLIDIVRFVCCAYHPSNDVIVSNVVLRWAVIGWLLTCCTKNYIEGNVKLALFYDWLFYEEGVDNVINIEPGILLMVNSVPKYVHMTNNLLEFLFILVDCYDVERKDLILKGMSGAFDEVKRKGVVKSFEVLTCCDGISPFLKEKLVKMLSLKNLSAFDQL